jgi:predicted aspartyl protease
VKPLSRTSKHAILRRVQIPDRSFLPKMLSVGAVTLFAVAEICAGAPKNAPASDSSRPRFEALPLTRSQQNHLLVRAYINGKPALLGVDSGAPISAIALKRRAHFGLTGIPGSSTLPARLQINGAFNNVAIAHNFRIGGLNLVDEPVVVVDLSGSGRASRMLHEQEIDGILGADILFPTGAVLDCQKQMLILKMDPGLPGKTPGAQYSGLRGVPIRVSETYNLYVDVVINGEPARLMVDTGAFATLLHRGFVRRLHVPLHETEFSSSAVNLKQRGVQVARIRRLSVGSVNIVGKNVGVVDLEGLIHSDLLRGSQPVAGLLGAEILETHHGIIDFGTRTLYLKN